MSTKISLPGILYAMRFPEDTGLVWQSLLNLYSTVSDKEYKNFQNIIAYPRLVDPKITHQNKQIFIEADFYDTSDNNKQSLLNIIQKFNIKAIIYISASTTEIDLKWLKRIRVKTINFEQESYDSNKKQSIWKSCIKILTRRILGINLHTMYLANSLSQVNFLLNFTKLPVSKIRLCINGVDTNFFSPETTKELQKSRICDSNLVVLSVAQAREEKNIPFLIDAAQEIFNLHPNISLSFIHVGDGPCLEKWKKHAFQSKISDKFLFVGKQTDIRPYLHSATILAHVATREGFGYVIAEAMSSEKPVIATPSTGSKEIIADGHTGLIIETNNSKVMAKELLDLLTNPEKIKKMGIAARERTKRLFSVDRQAEDLSLVINDILKDNQKIEFCWNRISSKTLRAVVLNLPMLWRFSKFQNLILKSTDLFTPNVTERINNILKKFKTVYFVQIGSNDGKQADPLYQLSHSNNHWSGLLVEPLPFLFKKLKDNYQDPRFNLENSAIGESNGEITFYYISPEAKKHLGDKLPFYYDQVGSFSLSHVLKHFDSEIEPYILETQVSTISLPNLLETHNISRLDLMHIDTEGFDYQILRQFNLKQFSPKIILFEHIHLPIEQKLMSQYYLFFHGYKILDLGRDFLAVKNS